MSDVDLKTRYRHAIEVEKAATAAVEIGLTAAEETFFTARLPRELATIDAGCGAGRLALGLWELEFRSVVGIDFSREMIAAARNLARRLEYEVPFRVGDLRRLALADGVFDALISDETTWSDWLEHEMIGTVAGGLSRVVGSGGRWLGAGRMEGPERELLDAAGWTIAEVALVQGETFWLAIRN